jgi:dihydropyrimidinase
MIIKNGNIVTADEIIRKDIKIKDGIIVSVEKNIPATNEADEEIIDALGRYILPGGIDVHTHMNLDTGDGVAVDDFYTGTAAALAGGTTTIIDHMGFGPKGCTLDHQLKAYHRLADGKAVIDYSFHGVIQHVDEDVLEKMGTLIESGLTSYKIYTTYSYSLSDEDIYKVLKRSAELALVVCVHPEDDEMLKCYTEGLRKQGHLTAEYYPMSRPSVCEAEAVKRLIAIAESIPGVMLYFVHISSKEALDEIIKARERCAVFFSETCTQYLYLDDSLYSREDALKYILSPPLRDKSNNSLLFRAIRDGDIQTVATDHCPFNYKTEKQSGKNDFTKCPKGLPGVQLRMSLMISRALKNIDITLNDVVRTCCENPARIFGIYPKKGNINPGSDADIIIVNPDKRFTIHHEDLIENVDYTPYENIELQGEIEKVILKGKIAETGENIKNCSGKFLIRNINTEGVI